MKQATVIPIETPVNPVAADSLLKALQDHAENGVMAMHWVDANGIITWANKAELDLVGYTAEEYIGKPISDFHVDEHIISDMLSRLHSNEALKSYESTLRCKDGSLKYVQVSSDVYRENGAFIHTRCFTVDVTQQKKISNANKESEFYYQQLLQNLKAAIYTTDAEGRITFYNKAAAELWGREPVIGIDLWCGSFKILNKDGGAMPLNECPMAIVLKEGHAVVGAEIIVVRPDGQMRHVAPHPEPVFDTSGKMIGAINMLIDITGIRNSERELRESEKKMRLLSESLENEVETRTHALQIKNEELTKSEERYHQMISEVEDYAIVLLDKQGIIQNWNKGAEKIKGYKDFEIIGKSFRSFYREEDRKNGLPEKLLSNAKEKGKAIHEGWRLRKDGTMFWGSIVITALHDADRNIVGFSKVTRDLTQRKLAEEQAAAYTRLLEFQNKELEQFAYAASHDLKEPLRKINFYNQYLLENLKGQLDEKGMDYLKRSVKATERMSDLIENLLTYSRVNTTDETLVMTDLNEIADDIVSSHKDLAETDQLIINKTLLPTVLAIPFQFRQLMDNIISNAIKYKHPERKTVIDIHCASVKAVEIKNPDATPLVDYYKISFADNGIGFEQQYAQRIFDIFQRLQPARYKGSGIGLAICKKIIQNHKGFVEATGTPDAGARFDIYIPHRNV